MQNFYPSSKNLIILMYVLVHWLYNFSCDYFKIKLYPEDMFLHACTAVNNVFVNKNFKIF